jgi:3',5'-nucleoside bisphosphate phosphatase
VPYLDFHLHTTVSDGVWSPASLFDFVRSAQIETFSITDHDTMGAYPVPADLAARCVTGMEVDTKCEGVTAHLLCYGINSSDAPLLDYLQRQRVARRSRMEEMVCELQRRGITIEMCDVERQAGTAASLGRPHLARALVDRGAVATVQEAFDRYIADDRDAYVSLDRLDSRQAIELAHASDAIVSIAHPARLKAPASLDALREAGADAIEVVHPTADASLREELLAYARRHDMMVTAGSDFHAPDNNYCPGVRFASPMLDRFLERVQRGAFVA